MSTSQSTAKTQTRGQKTRLRIQHAVVQLLEDEDYFDLSVKRICDAANVATGGFYFHYKNKEEVITEIFDEHYKTLWGNLTAASDYGDLYSAVFHANQVFVRAVSTRPGLSRCFNQHATIDQAIVVRWEASVTEWATAFAKTIASIPQVLAVNEDDAFLQVYLLFGYTDAMLYQVFVERDPNLARMGLSPDELTENLSVLWFRSLTGNDVESLRLAFQKKR